MKEKDFTSIIVSNLNNSGHYGYKIPDPPKGAISASAKRPFDFFAVTAGQCWFVEAKFFRGEVSVPFAAVHPHQYESLQRISQLNLRNVYPVVMIGFWEPRKWLKFITLHIDYLIHLREYLTRKSIPRGVIQDWLSNPAHHMAIQKREFPVGDLEEKVLYGGD